MRLFKRRMQGTKREDGYVVVWKDGKLHYRHRLVWEQAHGPVPDDMRVDHINGVPGDDWLDNLQLVTNAENARLGTEELKVSNTSGFNSVHMHRGRWRGQFRLDGKRIDCGRHDTAELAHAAVIQRRVELNAPTRRMVAAGQTPSGGDEGSDSTPE